MLILLSSAIALTSSSINDEVLSGREVGPLSPLPGSFVLLPPPAAEAEVAVPSPSGLRDDPLCGVGSWRPPVRAAVVLSRLSDGCWSVVLLAPSSEAARKSSSALEEGVAFSCGQGMGRGK